MKLSRTSLFLLVIYPTSLTALWLSLDLSHRLDKNSICRRTQAFLRLKGKADFCRSNPELIKRVLDGVDNAVEECQYQFRHRKWNCSTDRNSIRKIVRQDYRETAFIFAITTAGISYQVTNACNLGELNSCGCSRRLHSQTSVEDPNTDTSVQSERRSEFTWRGCKKNLKYGSEISEKFMDNTKNRRDPRALIIRHNNRAGILAVKTNIQKECKCHGISGQCNQKTCWQKLPTFRLVSDFLKSKFDGASKVMISNKGNELIVEGKTIKPPTNLDLVYTTDSPDFCINNPKTGSLGTDGRQCNASSKAVDGCGLLCCDRGFTSHQNTVEFYCKCRFHWCCDVRCQTCKENRTVHRCNSASDSAKKTWKGSRRVV